MDTLFTRTLGNSPTIRVLEVLIEGRELDHSLSDIAQQANVGWTTLHVLWPRLESTKIIRQTRTIGRAKMFKLNEKHPGVAQLIILFDTLIAHAARERPLHIRH